MSSSIEKLIPLEAIDEAKTIMVNVFKQTFDSEFESLYKIAYESTNDHEATKDILHEALLALIESGIQLFHFDKIQSLLITYTNTACANHASEIDEQQKFHQNQLNNVDEIINIDADLNQVEKLNAENAIREAVFKAYNELPKDRQSMLKETLLKGSSARKVASKYNLDKKQLLNINNYSIQILRKALFNKI
jgi:RNA polymerase sigma factor (sigma-70 family)